MSVNVVMLITDEDGVVYDESPWHSIMCQDGCYRTLCSGECFGYGESGVKHQIKNGKITCKKCITFIKEIKKIKTSDWQE